ncbi:MAG: hypothetical protein WBX00_10980, partial [Isosphaeraceae bacterium]
NSRSPVGRVRQFMVRYARAIGEGSAPQPDLGATLVGPEPTTAAGPEPSTTPIDASSVAPNGENEPGNVVLNTPIGQANGYLGENERDGVVILEATTDVPVRPARRSEADDEIVFIE